MTASTRELHVSIARVALASILGYEGLRAMQRDAVRTAVFEKAAQRAVDLNRPLLVVGDPYNGIWSNAMGAAYSCGSVCLDLTGCPLCPVAIKADITQPLNLASDSYVVFVSCVLEYVNDPNSAWNEILRVAGSGDNAFLVDVQPYTLTSILYPGAESVIVRDGDVLDVQPISTAEKIGTALLLAGLAWAAV